jgi:hypothetical protein
VAPPGRRRDCSLLLKGQTGLGICPLLFDHGSRLGREDQPSFVSRLLYLTLLAPDIQEAILKGRQPEGVQMEELIGGCRGRGRSSARDLLALIKPAIRCSDEVPATHPEKLKVDSQKPLSVRCKLREYLFVDRCEPSCRSHRR